MSLIECPTCKKEVSANAASCPGCGHPIKGKGVQTIEQTSKSAKLMLLAGWSLLFIGGATMIAQGPPIFIVLGFIVGLPLIVGGKITRWWKNK